MTERRLRAGRRRLGPRVRPDAAGARAAIQRSSSSPPPIRAKRRGPALPPRSAARTYPSVEALCADPDVEAVYVATPHQFHAENAITAARNGKHVLVEKPMALSLDECRAMIEAAREARRSARCRSQPQLRRAHRAHPRDDRRRNIRRLAHDHRRYFTDFLYRPRRPEELAADSGGGVLFNQAPHHVDIARLLGGGMVESVRALTGAWDRRAARSKAPIPRCSTFTDGAFATLTYSGYAHFDGDEFAGRDRRERLSQGPGRLWRGAHAASRR